jgi:hypothetical protein
MTKEPDCVQDLSSIEKRIKDTVEWLSKNGGNFASDQKQFG